MDLQLKGKVAVVTGGTRGIGRAIAEGFADEGGHVAICARNAEQVAGAVERLKGKGVKAFGQALDIKDGPALRGFVKAAAETLGGIDVLVSNPSSLLQGAAEADWQAMLDIDILGAVRVWEAGEPFLLEAAAKTGDACFLIISSTSSVSADRPSAYGAMKAAQIHFAKGVARANAAKKVRCNVISPGTVFVEDGPWGNVKRNPTGRMATAEEIAAAALFLASPRSAFTTGANMVIDGAITERAHY